MFKKAQLIKYNFFDKENSERPFDFIERRDYRVPNIGENIEFPCRAGRSCKVHKVTTILTHSYKKVYYVVDVHK